MAIEIVDFPMNSMVIFNSYVKVYQRVSMRVCVHAADGTLMIKNPAPLGN